MAVRSIEAVHFKEFPISGGRTVGVLKMHANLEETLKVLRENGYELMDFRGVFFAVDENPGLKEAIANSRFFTSQVGLGDKGAHLVDDSGNLSLTRIDGSEDMEKVAYVVAGGYPVSMLIYKNPFPYKRRYFLDAATHPDQHLLLVVGVKQGIDQAVVNAARE